MKVMVTGGGGQLATALERTVPPGTALQVLSVHELDITDEAAVRRAMVAGEPDVVVNTAAYTAVDKAESESELAFSVNARGARNVAIAARDCDARLIHVSTDFVFDGAASTPYAADATPNPLSVYGASKLEGERLVLETMDRLATVIRTAWLHSAYGANFLRTMLRLVTEKDEVKVVSDQVGTPTWAISLAGAIWSIAAAGDAGGVRHFTDAGVASWYDFAVAIAEEAAASGRYKVTARVRAIPTIAYPTPARRPAYSVLNCGEEWSGLGVERQHWRAGVRAVIRELGHV